MTRYYTIYALYHVGFRSREIPERGDENERTDETDRGAESWENEKGMRDTPWCKKEMRERVQKRTSPSAELDDA